MTGRRYPDLQTRIRLSCDVDEDGCWIWRYAKVGKYGYGKMCLRGVTMRAHRVSYKAFKGEIPEGHMVLHKCDKHACCNPECLFTGTAKSNYDDMVSKDRVASAFIEQALLGRRDDPPATLAPSRPAVAPGASDMVDQLNPQEFFRTDDMAMATFLKMEGHTPQQIGFVEADDNCYWWFRINDDLQDAIDSFNEGDAQVEPREWARNFHLTRKQMFAAEKHKPSPSATSGDAVGITA